MPLGVWHQIVSSNLNLHNNFECRNLSDSKSGIKLYRRIPIQSIFDPFSIKLNYNCPFSIKFDYNCPFWIKIQLKYQKWSLKNRNCRNQSKLSNSIKIFKIFNIFWSILIDFDLIFKILISLGTKFKYVD